MALNSVDPNNFNPGMPPQAQDDNLMMKPPQTPIPGPNGVSSNELGANQSYKGFSELTKATTEGDKAIAAAAGKGGGGGGGFGSIIGSAVGFLGDIFSDRRLKENVHEVGHLDNGLPVYNYHYKGSDTGQIGLMADEVQKKHPEAVHESQGYKTVNYDNATKMAGGGPVQDQQGPDHTAIMGAYLTGALHQRDFGGTPDTLEQAANMVKQMMMQQQGQQEPEMQMADNGFAAGGMAGNPQHNQNQMAGNPNQALMSALGLADNPQQMGQQPPQPQQPEGMGMGGAPGMSSQMPPQAQQGLMNKPAMGVPGQPPMAPQQAPMASQGMMRPQPQMQKPMQQPMTNPAMRGFADGGMNMQQEPLAPGQPFQGEGEVKGPGGPQDDMIPAKLSNGEFVMSQPATAFFGVDKLIKMNEQGKQGFMQAKQQVDMNQPQGGGAPPMAAPPGGAGPSMMPPGMPPMPQEGMAKGGAAVMRSKGSGYCGM